MTPDPDDWRKASYSFANHNCVQVASGVEVRDTKNPDGPVLQFSPAAWRLFVEETKETER